MTASTVSSGSIGSVTYVATDKDYFKKRQLKRTAGAFGLWAIGISAVVSGDFSGWNGGIAQAGWAGMLIAAIVSMERSGWSVTILAKSAALPGEMP